MRHTSWLLLLATMTVGAADLVHYPLSGAAGSLQDRHPAWQSARSRYGMESLRLDGRGALTAEGSQGGFSVPEAGDGAQRVQLILLPDAHGSGVRVRILAQTDPRGSEYYGWEFAQSAGGFYTRLNWFRGAPAFLGARIGEHRLSVAEPLVMELRAEPSGSGVRLSALAGPLDDKLRLLSQFEVDGTARGVPVLTGRSPGMLFYQPQGRPVAARLISGFAAAIGQPVTAASGPVAGRQPSRTAQSLPSVRDDAPVPAASSGSAREPLQALARPGYDIIVDDADPGAEAISGYWRPATGASNHHAGMSQYAESGGQLDRFRFTPNLPVAGRYEVMTWNSCYPREQWVAHRIVHAGGEVTVGVNQDCRGGGTYGEWFSLGEYRFERGSTQYVEISDAGARGGTRPYIGADAVRFVLNPEDRSRPARTPEERRPKTVHEETAAAVVPPGSAASPRELVLDTGDAGTSGVGRWISATSASHHHGGGSLYAEVGGGADTYVFRASLQAGRYRVETWNACYSPRHNRVPHSIRHADGTATVFVDQDCASGVTGRWQELGTYRFDSEQRAVVGISDAGLRSAGTSYIGADAVRFTRLD